jgi:lysophospholipase L1-like esterase
MKSSVFRTTSKALLALVLLECLARVISSFDEPARGADDDWQTLSPRYGWVLTPGFEGTAFGARRVFDAEGYRALDSEQVRGQGGDPGRKRVLFFGDSCTFGNGVGDDKTYVEVLDEQRPDVDCINLAVPGYSSKQGVLRMKDMLPALEPDAIVFSFNFNDRRYVLGDDQRDSEHWFEELGRRRGPEPDPLDQLHVVRLLRDLLRTLESSKAERTPDPSTEASPAGTRDARSIPPRVSAADHRANLTEAARFAAEQGVPLIFLLLTDNPVRSERLDRGIAHLERGEFDAGVNELRIVLKLGGWYQDLARRELALALQAAGSRQVADQVAAIQAPKDRVHGGNPVRTAREYNDIMRAVAASEGVPLVEAGPALSATPVVYDDHCHFDAQGHQLVADMLRGPLLEVLGED